MTFETVQSYFDRLSDTEFNDKFLELAHSSAFSRVVSGAALTTVGGAGAVLCDGTSD